MKCPMDKTEAKANLLILQQINLNQQSMFPSFPLSTNLAGDTWDFQKRIDGKTEYDYKAMEEWRLSTLASWTTEDMQAFYERYYQYTINDYQVIRGSQI